jgi:hypothetical protein
VRPPKLAESITGNVFRPELAAPMPRTRIPSYRCYKPKDLGLVVISGRQHYLGRYGSPESVAAYNRLIQEWLAGNGACSARSAPVNSLSINELTPTDPADDNRVDWWDHTAYDPEHRLVLCVVPGAWGAEEAEAVVADVKERTEGRSLRLMTSDDYPAYETAIERV